MLKQPNGPHGSPRSLEIPAITAAQLWVGANLAGNIFPVSCLLATVWENHIVILK